MPDDITARHRANIQLDSRYFDLWLSNKALGATRRVAPHLEVRCWPEATKQPLKVDEKSGGRWACKILPTSPALNISESLFLHPGLGQHSGLDGH